ncbi:MAG TPA: hypothetical protein VD969_17070 [Symbiobacteriaceae bacterium]|nr:hypothetical protein [Symbiobacteriaceae bacterium]
MEVRNFKGAKVISVDPERIQLPLYGDAPQWRIGSPGTLLGNVATGVQLAETSKKRIATPDPTWVKVTFRDVSGQYFLTVAAVAPPENPKQKEPDTYPLKFASRAKAPAIRGLKALFEASRIELRPDVWYEMDTEIAEDEGGAFVCGCWTTATITPRIESQEDAAAAKQGTNAKHNNGESQ